MKRRFILIDGHALLFRAFYAYPELTTKDGELVNAVYGFTSILLTVIRELEPTHIAVSFDLAKPTFRHIAFEDYKAHREETPQELIDQEGRVREVVEALNIPVYEKEGFEADDVIGTMAEQSKRFDIETIIVTGDLDALQLVDDDSKGKVHVYVPGRGKNPTKIYDEKMVEEKLNGLEPEQVVDLKGLAGDVSDNIPGVKGIGPKTAAALLKRYRTLEEVYKNIKNIKKEFGKSVYTKLVEGRKLAKMSQKLARIITKVPLKLSLKACMINDYDKAKVMSLFDDLGFKSLKSKLPNDSFEQMVQEEMFK